MGRSFAEIVERAWCSRRVTCCETRACFQGKAAGIMAAPCNTLGTACCSECPKRISASWWRRLENDSASRWRLRVC